MDVWACSYQNHIQCSTGLLLERLSVWAEVASADVQQMTE